MKIIELTEYLVKSICKEPDLVSVKEYETEDDHIQIEVLVSEGDIGAVIGKSGNTANAIRTIIQTASYANDKKRIKINFDSF